MAAFGPMGSSNSPADHRLRVRWLAVLGANQGPLQNYAVRSAANLGTIQHTNMITTVGDTSKGTSQASLIAGSDMDDAMRSINGMTHKIHLHMVTRVRA